MSGSLGFNQKLHGKRRKSIPGKPAFSISRAHTCDGWWRAIVCVSVLNLLWQVLLKASIPPPCHPAILPPSSIRFRSPSSFLCHLPFPISRCRLHLVVHLIPLEWLFMASNVVMCVFVRGSLYVCICIYDSPVCFVLFCFCVHLDLALPFVRRLLVFSSCCFSLYILNHLFFPTIFATCQTFLYASNSSQNFSLLLFPFWTGFCFRSRGKKRASGCI